MMTIIIKKLISLQNNKKFIFFLPYEITICHADLSFVVFVSIILT